MLNRFIAVLGVLLVTAIVHAADVKQIEITNNQPFAIQMPLRLYGAQLQDSRVVQNDGDDSLVLINVDAKKTATIDTSAEQKADRTATIAAKDDGVSIEIGDKPIGTLAWDLVVVPNSKDDGGGEGGRPKDFAADFKALALKFTKTSEGPVFEKWSAQGAKDGINLSIDLFAFRDGTVDVTTTAINESAPKTDVYAAVISRFQPAKPASRSVCYNNAISALGENASSPWRAGGDKDRHMFIQRGVDWINFKSDGGPSLLLLNDFAASFTVHKEKTAKTPAHWTGANSAQLAEEVQTAGDATYSVTELAHANLKMYRSRVEPNVLPDKDQPMKFTHRMMISDQPIADERADQTFVGYTTFTPHAIDGDALKVNIGAPFTKFGTAYFPYSTLGENFEAWHMPGQSKETYWPLSADTVKNYKLFADDIKRDLRIAKAMGFQTIRMHHLEMIDTLDKSVQNEYLDFFFGELKHLGLTALIDVKLPTARVVELVKRYGPLIDGVEIDNEVLIFGINDNEVQGWKDTYKAVKEINPNMPVWLTAHTNTGAFARLLKLGVPFDRLGQHAYMDSISAIPSARDYSLAMANYATKLGKSPIITEWNWRFLTRMTPEARAEVYTPIFENVLKTGSMPIMYQFEFAESLAMASKSLRGIRHYELLNLSRRPKPEAFHFMSLIRHYGDPNGAQHLLHTTHPVYQLPLQPNTDVDEPLSPELRNDSEKDLSVAITPELPPGVELNVIGDKTVKVPAHSSVPVKLQLKMSKDQLPGFYHAFVRFDAGDGLTSYAWIELQKPGAPKIDKDKVWHEEVKYSNDALDYDFNRDLAVVFATEPTEGPDASKRWDVESAWLLYQTLESATGRPVKWFSASDLPDELRKTGNLIVVGMPKTHELIQSVKDQIQPEGKSWVTRLKANDQHGDWLIVGGDDEATLNLSAIDLTLKYWANAKDAGMRRVPLTDKPIEKGADPSALP
jgi:hypothetical protein